MKKMGRVVTLLILVSYSLGFNSLEGARNSSRHNRRKAAQRIQYRKDEDPHVQGAIEASLEDARKETSRAQEDIDRAIALSLQDQEESRVTQENIDRVIALSLDDQQRSDAAYNAELRSKRNAQKAESELQKAIALVRKEHEKKTRLQQEATCPVVQQPKSMATVRQNSTVRQNNRVQRARPPVWVEDIELRVVRVVLQSEATCGYWSALNGTVLYNALRLGISDVLDEVFLLLQENRYMNGYLANAQKVLKKVVATQGLPDVPLNAIDTGGIKYIFDYFSHVNENDYTIVPVLLPEKLSGITMHTSGIDDVLKIVKSTPNKVHIFVLSTSRQADPRAIGHWVSVVAVNNGTKIICYCMDSLPSQAHTITWKRLIGLLQQVQY